MAFVALTGLEDHVAVLVRHDHFYPGLNDVQRPGRKIVADLVVRNQGLNLDLLAGRDRLGHHQFDGHGGTRAPFICNFWNLDLPLEPFFGQRCVFVSAFKLEGHRHELVGRQEAVAAVLPVVACAIIIEVVAAGRIEGIGQGHVAFATFDGLCGIVGCVPSALAPVVVLILELHPAHLVDLFVDKLLVARSAKFGTLEEAMLQALDVFPRVGPDQKMTEPLRRFALAKFEQVALGLGDDVIGVALDVGFFDGVTGQARDPFLVSSEIGEILREHILRPGKQGDGIVTAPTVSGGFRAVLFSHDLLYLQEGHIHGSVPVGADLPFLDNLFVARGGPARRRPPQRPGVEGSSRARLGQARRKRPIFSIEVAVILRQLVIEPDRFVGIHEQRQHGKEPHDQEGRARPELLLRRENRLYSFAGSCPNVAKYDGEDVRQQRGQQRKRRNDVHQVPPVADLRLEDGLIGQHEARDGRHQGRGHREVARELEVRHGHPAVEAPVPELVPGKREDEHEPDNRVQQHHDLVRDAEREQVDRKPRERFEGQQTDDKDHEPVSPLSCLRVDFGKGCHFAHRHQEVERAIRQLKHGLARTL